MAPAACAPLTSPPSRGSVSPGDLLRLPQRGEGRAFEAARPRDGCTPASARVPTPPRCPSRPGEGPLPCVAENGSALPRVLTAGHLELSSRVGPVGAMHLECARAQHDDQQGTADRPNHAGPRGHPPHRTGPASLLPRRPSGHEEQMSQLPRTRRAARHVGRPAPCLPDPGRKQQAQHGLDPHSTPKMGLIPKVQAGLFHPSWGRSCERGHLYVPSSRWAP